MEQNLLLIESQYPLNFRQTDAQALGELLKSRSSVVLIGMKRVGISNFLRFFTHHQDIVPTYIDQAQKHLFINIDLNDLVEREIFPFWVLTLKRISDAVETSELNAGIKRKIELLFLDAIQSKNLFLVVDTIRKSLGLIVGQGLLPTIFFVRFDRMKDSVTTEFFSNLEGLKDASHHKLSFVFTSFRSLDFLSPKVFLKPSLSVFSRDLGFKPAERKDMAIIFETFQSIYPLKLTSKQTDELFELVDGYTQYLQLALISLSEFSPLSSQTSLFDLLSQDERINLQSEELWDSLTTEEQIVLLKVNNQEEISDQDRHMGKYLWDTGFISQTNSVFSPLLACYLKQLHNKPNKENDFSKKELMLFEFLKSHSNEICEREDIIENVWSEVESLGVSDWAIDRLVARVRHKLKKQSSPYQVVTVKTRGYKLQS